MNKISSFLGSNAFLAIIISFFVLQALWIAFSFRFPLPADEAFHFGAIEVHAKQISPILNNQPESFDWLGFLPANSHGLYHYIMSFPYRAAELFTQNKTTLIIFIRMLNIALVAVGLWLYARLLARAKIKREYINVGLFLFTLLPIVPFMATTINYDNLLFPLTALCLIFAVRAVQSKEIIWRDYALTIIVGLLACLAKFTFMPILAIIVTFLFLDAWAKHKGMAYKQFIHSFASDSSKIKIIILSVIILLSGILFFENARNIFIYGTTSPPCEKVLAVDRCNKHWGKSRNEKISKTKDKIEFDLPGFTLGWVKRMTSLGNTGSSRQSMKVEYMTSPHILRATMFFASILGLAGILFAWSSLNKDRSWYLLITVAIGLVAIIFTVNLLGYAKSHQHFANQPRYNLSVIPILITFAVVSYSYILRNYRYLKFGLLFAGILIFSQGGGVTTHIMKSKDSWYWNDSRVIRVNQKAKALLDPVIIEK